MPPRPVSCGALVPPDARPGAYSILSNDACGVPPTSSTGLAGDGTAGPLPGRPCGAPWFTMRVLWRDKDGCSGGDSVDESRASVSNRSLRLPAGAVHPSLPLAVSLAPDTSRHASALAFPGGP